MSSSESDQEPSQKRKREKRETGVHQVWCGSEELEQVSSYTYLGVLLSRSGVFFQQARKALNKGIAAYKNVWPVIFRSQSADPETWYGLFFGAVASTSLCGAEVWAYPYAEFLERVSG
ncbi:hypothetical protein GE061_015163 [Apolygus lucorum]|uniref:Uncharacterized protein n=1 Tax=Apolygus lucorum TaxID=248454 RepID=A0A8S9XN12_APOLU|nr:hypothetical protein GE061_015163 [Apolygus lucorum]